MLKKIDILEELHRQGFEIGYTSVCNYICAKENPPKRQEAFIRQVYQRGEVCEFDWGEIKLYIDGKLTRLQLAVFTSAYGNYRYANLYHRQDTLAFMESHTRFFTFTGGVYRQMVYDNMRVAVSKFVGSHEKEPTQSLLQLRGHYGFSHRFCNACRGNEKGHVERSVEYVRRKSFAMKDRFASIDEANQWLYEHIKKINFQKQTLTGKTANELFAEEKSALLRLPKFELISCEQVQLRVDKYSTISYRTNRYSVPEHLVGEFVDVVVSSDNLQMYHKNEKQAFHTRNFDKHRWIIDIEHYLSTFKKKPGALPGSVALASTTYLKELYFQHFNGENRHFIDFLKYCKEKKVSEEKLEDSVKRLLQLGSDKMSIEKLLALVGNQNPEPKASSDEDSISILAKQQLSALAGLMQLD